MAQAPATAPGFPGLTAQQATEKLAALLPDSLDDSNDEVEQTPETSEVSDEADAGLDEATEDEITEDDVVEDDIVDGEPDEEPADDETEEPTLYTVKVDGQDVKVTLDEALAGFRMAKHNTQTAQKLAEDRKALEAREAEIAAKREVLGQYEERLAQLDEAIAEMEGKEPDWDEVKRERPESYAEEFADWQRHAKRKQKLKDERTRVKQDREKDAQAEMSKTLERERKLLHEKLPVMKDATKSVAFRDQLVTYAESQGITREEFLNTNDHRAIVILDKARRYDAIVARKQAATAPAGKKKTPTTAMRPGAPRARVPANVKARQEALARAKKTGTRSDAARALEHLVGE